MSTLDEFEWNIALYHMSVSILCFLASILKIMLSGLNRQQLQDQCICFYFSQLCYQQGGLFNNKLYIIRHEEILACVTYEGMVANAPVAI